MRKISILNLMTLTVQKQQGVADLAHRLRSSAIVQKHRELDGEETVLNNVENFNELLKEYITRKNECSECKGKLAEANVVTKLENGDSIIQNINTLKSLRDIISTLETYINKRDTLSRAFDGSGGSAYYKVEELNYSIEALREQKQDIEAKIEAIESEISTLNAITLVELSF